MRSLLKTSCVCAFVMLFTTTAFSQETANVTANHAPSQVSFLIPNYNPVGPLGYANGGKNILEIADGSQFHEQEFKDAKVSGSEVLLKARYNAYLDEMEVKYNDEIVCVNKNLQKRRVLFTADNLEYKILDTDNSDKKEKHSYFTVLLENSNVSLYKKDAKELVIALEKVPYMTPAPKIITEFQDAKSEFYVEVKENGNAIKVPKTRRGVANLFPGKEKLIKKFIKQNKINVTEEDGLKKLINYVNSL
ncbi:hypothetical protein H2O64_13150 [Kordia sp. YSTF-M3]|uniref:Uncharacterized protein n=1 Tax=Kordia aestuariivivens TaxID=2759037 RepID=A0ABR7QB51_9FLAO|nr:hypothetical protein [Kordia aestuariivivens]MBC8755618.1 hypothetical protein [Kordia aestuariivivens]